MESVCEWSIESCQVMKYCVKTMANAPLKEENTEKKKKPGSRKQLEYQGLETRLQILRVRKHFYEVGARI